MTGTKLAAKFIIGLVLFFIFILLNILYIRFSGKDKKITIKYIFLSIVFSTTITIVGSMLLEPWINGFKHILIVGEEKIESGLEAMASLPDEYSDSADLSPGSQKDSTEVESPPDGQESELPDAEPETSNQDEKNLIFPTGSNRILYYSDAPLEDRVLVPDDSLYPDITMKAVRPLLASSASLPGYQGSSRTSDSVTYAFTASTSDPSGLYEELKTEILKNPLVGDMIMRGLAEAYPNFEKDPLMKEFLTACNDAFEHQGEDKGMAFWIKPYKFADEETEAFVSESYRRYAEALCQFLDTFTNYGVHEFTCKTHYSVNSFCVDAIYIRTMRNSESLSGFPALVLYKTNDDGSIACVIGFDLNDKGLFIYDSDVI